MQTERGRRFKGATPGGRPGAAGGTGAKDGDEPRFALPIIAQDTAKRKISGRVLLVLEPGSSPTLVIEAQNERAERELAGLIDTARRLASMAGEWAE